ncbi:MAG: hypothetical protein GY943_34540, partial [Chloroflexi bacterium]|nr:hypothetical protein [Chloroflexota bacterium]
QLSENYELWARERVVSSRATQLNVNNISGTEWPIFSSVYYLWATEALQPAWEDDPSLAPELPTDHAQRAIDTAVSLIADPNHAAWVEQHWGDDYLTQENLFYRMLLISGLTSYQNLTEDVQYEPLLLAQVESLSKELDESPYGLLDDYPGQCYPIDILPAIAVIQRADGVLGTDHSDFVARAVRGFDSARLDLQTGLPAYVANSRTGDGIGPARGVGISYMLIWAPEVWPDTAADWYGRYDTRFWQESWLFAGVREFSNKSSYSDWLIDVDAGPVVAGYGTAASAFGIGAARVNGRFDQAYPLSAEALVASWPLSNGTLLGARLLSNLSDAPYIGESALLFNLTRQSVGNGRVTSTGRLPFVVYLGLCFYAFGGIVCTAVAVRTIKRCRNNVQDRPE